MRGPAWLLGEVPSNLRLSQAEGGVQAEGTARARSAIRSSLGSFASSGTLFSSFS